MSRSGEGRLRLLAAGGLLMTALLTVLVQAQNTVECYGLVSCARAREACHRQRESLRAQLPFELLRLSAATNAQATDS